MRFGEKLKGLREAKRWEQQDLAERSGVAQNTISKYESGERGKRPSKDAIQRLSKALGCKETDLWTPTPRPERTVVREDRYPSRRQAQIILRGLGYPEWVIDALGADAYKAPEDPGWEHWLARGEELGKAKDRVESWADDDFNRRPELSDLKGD